MSTDGGDRDIAEIGSPTSEAPNLFSPLEMDNPLDVLKYYQIHGSTEQIRISAASKLAEFEHHKKKALDDTEIEDSSVKISMNLDTDVPDKD